MLLKLERYVWRFVFTVAASIGALWGVTEVSTYFTGDLLKNAIGPYWALVFIVLPVIAGLLVVYYSAEVSTLSKYPISIRKQIWENPLIGRDDDLLWLKQGKDRDRLIFGQPGSGKTFLLGKLVEEETNWLGPKYLFAVENDRAKLASEINALRPRGVIVDDAQSNQEMLLNLKQLRQELKLSFVILATCWLSHKDEIASLLNIPHTPDYLREIPLMDRPKILAVIRSAGFDKNQTLRDTVGRAGINELEREIIDQSVGRPGLAITLVSLCLAAMSGPEALQSLRSEILSGQALSREVRKSLRNEMEKQCLACFSLGGNSGMLVEAVSQILDLQPREVQEIINNLTNGGVVWEVSESRLAVYPDTLRHALIGEVFFDSPQALSGWDQLILIAPSRTDALSSIIGAAANGCKVNDEQLRTLIEEAVQQLPYASHLWENYAWIGKEQTQWVLEHHPEMLVWISKPGLRYLPVQVIPLLLEKAQGDKRELHSTVDHPLRIIQTWVNQEYGNFSSARQKRFLLLTTTTNWLSKQADLFSAFRAIHIALSPTVDFGTLDPTGDSMTVHLGCISSSEMQFLGEKWKEIFETIKKLPITSEWKPIYELIEDWVYDRLPNVKMTEEQIDTKRSIADMMLRDIAPIAKSHPAILQWIDQLGTQIGLAIDYEVDDFLDVINQPYWYAHGENWEEAQSEIDNALNELAEKLVFLGPSTVADKLKWAISEAELINSFPAQGYHLCAKLAVRTDSPIDWAKVFQMAELPGNLIIPFLDQAARLSQEGWVELALVH